MLTPYELAKRYISGRGHWTNDPEWIVAYLVAETDRTQTKNSLELSPRQLDRMRVSLVRMSTSIKGLTARMEELGKIQSSYYEGAKV